MCLDSHPVRRACSEKPHGQRHAQEACQPRAEERPGRAPWLPGSLLRPPTLFRKLSLHCSGPPGEDPLQPVLWPAGGAGRSLMGWGVVLSPSCRPAAGTAHPEEVPLPVGQCRGVRRRGHPIWGRGAVRPSGRALDHTCRRAPSLPVHSPGDADAFQGAIRHAVSNLRPISGPHRLEPADWGFSLVNTVIIP